MTQRHSYTINPGQASVFSIHKIHIELLLLFSNFETANFNTTRMSSNKFRVRIGHGLIRILVCCSGAWRYLKLGREIEKSLPFIFFITL